jgi:hypothetical protein
VLHLCILLFSQVFYQVVFLRRFLAFLRLVVRALFHRVILPAFRAKTHLSFRHVFHQLFQPGFHLVSLLGRLPVPRPDRHRELLPELLRALLQDCRQHALLLSQVRLPLCSSTTFCLLYEHLLGVFHRKKSRK